MIHRKEQMMRYMTIDALMAVIVWIIFFIFRRYANDSKLFPDVVIWAPNYSFWVMLFLYPAYCLLVHYLSGYYLRPFRKDWLVELATTFFASIIIALTIFFVLLLSDKVVSYHYYYVSFSVLFVLQFSFTYVPRLLITKHLYKKMKEGALRFNTLIIGTGQNAMMVCEQLQKARKLDGNYVVGFIDVGETMLVDREKVVGSLSDIETIIHRFHVTELYVAVEKTNEHHLFELINQLIVFQVSIKLLPSSFHFLTSRVKMNQFSISPYIDVTALSMSDWEICTKRFLDVVMSLVVLSLFAPFFLYLYIRVKMSASGSALYFQERIGLHGKPFKIIKFRTMYPDAENGTPQLTTLNDERITPFGNTLRRYRLDELPQFINILKGEMSIVGPRPERKYFIDQIMKKAPYYCLLYNVRPGLTSWGPIKVGYTHSIDKMIDRLNNDIVYLENMSLLSDMQILFYTISILIKGKGI